MKITRPHLECIRCAGIAWVMLFPVASRADDWPQFRGPQRDNAWNEAGVPESFAAEGLSVSWRVPVGRGLSSPIVAAGRVYLTDVLLHKPLAGERVLCFDEATGQLLWRKEQAAEYPEWTYDPGNNVGGSARATPLFHESRVYALGASGRLVCLDSASGAAVWEKDLAREYGLESFTAITPSPLIENDLLILCIWARPGASVIALDERTGREVWRALDDAFTYSSPLVIEAGGRRQLIVWTQEAINSLEPATGRILWRLDVRTPGDSAVATPVFDGSRLLVSGMMLDLGEDGLSPRMIWPVRGTVTNRILSATCSPLLKNGCAFSANTGGELVCVDAETGMPLWMTAEVTGPANGSSIHLTSCGSDVLLYTDKGDLIRAHLDRDGYRELSRVHLIDPTTLFGGRLVAWPPPAYANGHIIVRSDRELIRASLVAQP